MESDRRAGNIYKLSAAARALLSSAVQIAEGKLKLSSRSDAAYSGQTPLKSNLISTHHPIMTDIQTKYSEGRRKHIQFWKPS